MKSRKKTKLIIILSLLFLLIGASVFFILRQWDSYKEGYFSKFDSRPVVLISNPIHKQTIPVGDTVSINASSFAEQGIKELEIWIDNSLIKKVESDDVSSTELTATTTWTAQSMGKHEIVVRSISSDDIAGQSSLVVMATDGQNLDEIDEDTTDRIFLETSYDIKPEESNMPMFAPDNVYREMGFLRFFRELFVREVVVEEEPIVKTLRIEFLELQTNTSYETTHCYIGLFEDSSLWYPDTDDNQSTNEYFASLDGINWDVGEYLSENMGIVINQNSDEDIIVNMNCVGTRNDGNEAYRLGWVRVEIPLEHWDSVSRRVVSTEGEDSFLLEYKVSEINEQSSQGIPLYLDPSMTPPSNLRYDSARQELVWDYERQEDELVIDGFAIYLNGTLQWTTRYNELSTRIPAQWLNPPCGVNYAFTVTAYRGSIPEGPESVRTIPGVTFEGGAPGSPACDKQVIVTFERMETRDLGTDRSSDPGDMGPIVGVFYANRHLASIDGRCNSRNDHLCSELGWNHNSEYSLANQIPYYGIDSHQQIVTLEEDGVLRIGYLIEDCDRGNCTERVCGGEILLSYRDVGSSHEKREFDIVSDEVPIKCKLHVTVQLSPSSSAGTARDWTPLPQLWVTDMTVDERTGQNQVHLKNVGTATLESKDVEIAFSDRDGSEYSLPLLRWENVTLEPGETRIFQDERFRPIPALSICVEPDPHNKIHELFEESGAFNRAPYCQDLPDLRVTDVLYNSQRDILHITIQNMGTGTVVERRLEVGLEFASGQMIKERWDIVSLGRWESTVLSWTDLTAEQRNSMRNGYTVHLDPDNLIAEIDDSNNSHEIGKAKRVKAHWYSACIPFWYIRGDIARESKGTINLEIEKGFGDNMTRINKWSSGELTLHRMTSGGYMTDLNERKCWIRRQPIDLTDKSTEDIEVYGDERLKITASGTAKVRTKTYNLYPISETFDVVGGLRGMRVTSADLDDISFCGGEASRAQEYRYLWGAVSPVPDDQGRKNWRTVFVLCVQE